MNRFERKSIQATNKGNTLTAAQMQILDAIPALREVYNSVSLYTYFLSNLNRLRQCRRTKEFDIMARVITSEVKRLYGPQKAAGVFAQLKRIPVVETGTHLSFVRDFESVKGHEERPRLSQNILISAALMDSMDCRYHIGVYPSACSLVNPCSGGYFQLGTSVYPISSQKNLSAGSVYLTDAVSSAFFNPTVLWVEKIKMLSGLLKRRIEAGDTEMQVVHNRRLKFFDQIISSGNQLMYDKAQKGIDSLSDVQRNRIEQLFVDMDEEACAVYGIGFADVDKQYADMKKVFDRTDLSLADQIALVQTADIQRVLPQNGAEHITVDAMRVIGKFFENCMRDKETIWYQIFADPQKRDAFLSHFYGVRTSWKEGESPFDMTVKRKGFGSTKSIPVAAFEHTPETIASYLSTEEIIPNTALIVMGFYSASMLAHGGFFQSNYGKESQDRFVDYLKQFGFDRHVAAIEPVPAEMVLLSLAGVAKQTETGVIPLKLTEIMRLPESQKENIFKTIPHLSGQTAFENAAPVLLDYLNRTAPGYVVEKAAQHLPNKAIHISRYDVSQRPVLNEGKAYVRH